MLFDASTATLVPKSFAAEKSAVTLPPVPKKKSRSRPWA